MFKLNHLLVGFVQFRAMQIIFEYAVLSSSFHNQTRKFLRGVIMIIAYIISINVDVNSVPIILIQFSRRGKSFSS